MSSVGKRGGGFSRGGGGNRGGNSGFSSRGGSRGGFSSRGGSRGGGFSSRGTRGRGRGRGAMRNGRDERTLKKDQKEQEESAVGYHRFDDSDDEAMPEKRNPKELEFVDEEMSDTELYGSEDDTDDDMDGESLFSQKSKNKRDKFDFEDESGDEFMDLSDMLDGPAPTKSNTKKVVVEEKKKKPSIYEEDQNSEDEDEEDSDQDQQDESEIESEEEEEEEEDDEEEDVEEEDEYNNEESNKKMMELMDGLDTEELKKLTNLPDVTEMFSKESSTGVRPSDDTLDLNQLLAMMPEEFDTLKTQLQPITSGSALPVPLNNVEQAKLNRRMATEETTKQLDKWDKFIRHQRELATVVYRRRVQMNKDIGSVGEAHQVTSLDDAIKGVMKKDGLTATTKLAPEKTTKSKQQQQAEKERLGEIIKLRNRMYYEAQRNKRQSKIKSKKYRKILKKQRDKDMEKRDEELSKIDPEYAKNRQIAAEEMRIRERMSLRHTNQSKFMKNVMRGGLNKERRQAINEQSQVSNDLLGKMKSVTRDYDDDQSDSDEDRPVSNNKPTRIEQDKRTPQQPITENDIHNIDGSMSIKSRLETKLKMLGMDSNKHVADKGINSLKFMQTSLERDLDQRLTKEAHADEDDLATLERQETEKKQVSSNRIALHRPVASNKQSSLSTMDSGSLVDRVGMSSGHKLKTGSIQIGQLDQLEIEKSNNNNNNNNIQKKEKNHKVMDHIKMNENDNKQDEQQQEDQDNPWMQGNERKIVGQGSKEKKKASHQLLIDMDKVLDDAKKTGSSDVDNEKNQKNQKNKRSDDDQLDNERARKRKNNSMSLIANTKQKALLKEAFKRDGVEDEFAREKDQLIEDQVEQVVDPTIPGWGNWTGDGVSQSKHAKRKLNKLKEERKKKVSELASGRLDAKNSNVIINDKAIEGGVGKYMISKLPSHYANKEQYESTLNMPIGKDFNTYTAFKQLVEPKVQIEKGQMIDPASKKQLADYKKEVKEAKNKNIIKGKKLNQTKKLSTLPIQLQLQKLEKKSKPVPKKK